MEFVSKVKDRRPPFRGKNGIGALVQHGGSPWQRTQPAGRRPGFREFPETTIAPTLGP